MVRYPRFIAASAHVAPIFHDTERTIDKACDVIAEAAGHGARLIAFPESFVPGFPVWASVIAPIHTHDYFRQLAAAAILIDGPEMQRIRETARQHSIYISLGFTEGTTASVGCLWNANVLVGPDGAILNHHRKLVPTFFEKLIWANGDGGGLRVCDTEVGRVGMLICGENTNPLARYTLMAQGEQVHISTYPPVWPTRSSDDGENYDLEQAIRIRAGAHAFEAKAFNIVASAYYDSTLRVAMAPLGREALAALDASPRAISMIIDPTGSVISPVQSTVEGITYAEIDLARCVEPKRFHDVVGYYNRFDIFKLTVDRSANRPILFEPDKGPTAHAEPTGGLNTDNSGNSGLATATPEP